MKYTAQNGWIGIPDFKPDVAKPLALLAECPAYQPTPCVILEHAALGAIRLKNEAQRMGLGSFKALGGVYAVAALIGEHWRAKTGEALAAQDYKSDSVRQFAGELTFTCASAGNHGLAVAAGARIFGARARIHLATTVPESFEGRLLEQSAEVVRSGVTYEESLDAAMQDADSSGALLLADGAWEDYWMAPSLVMEGYGVLAQELAATFAQDGNWPTHVFLQAGVGGLAAGVTAGIRALWSQQPDIIIVEPDRAPCLKASAEAGTAVTVEGPESNMGRLDCKFPSLLALKTFYEADVSYLLISDAQAESACTELAALGYPSTPSGVAGFAGLRVFRERITEQINWNPLVIVSEGAVA